MTLEPDAIRSRKFREAHERDWTELDRLVTQALSRGLSSLEDRELERLPMLFRSTVSSLEVARRTTMDRALVGYLDALATRAYLAIYASRRAERGLFLRFLFQTFPRRVRGMAAEVAASSGITAAGTWLAYTLVRRDPEWYFAFVAEGLAGDRVPGATREMLRATLYARETDGLDVFASFLFTHNAGIGILAFALGFLAGVPTSLLLFTNGLMLGAFLALFASHGLLVPLLGWLLPHGIPEFGAIVLCGAAGLHVGRALVSPGPYALRDALVRAGRRASTVVTGCVLLFAVAGLVEGIFRQTVLDDRIRFAVAAFNAAWFLGWVGLSGRGPEVDDGD